MKDIFIIDDSVLFRTKITKEIEDKTEFKVIGTANDTQIATKKLKLLKTAPDIILLDVELPGMDGLTYLKELLEVHKIKSKVVVCTSYWAKYKDKAIQNGAFKVVDKENYKEIFTLLDNLYNKPTISQSHFNLSSKQTKNKLIAIGASTGGLEILSEILQPLPSTISPIVVVQHLSRDILYTFLPKIQEKCKVKLKVAHHGVKLEDGCVYFAPYNKHLKVKKVGLNDYEIVLDDSNDTFHKPSIDILFHSIAKEVKHNAVAFILTGMGNDGVEGIKAIKDAGGKTYAQDKDSCVVFGMPKAAIESKKIDDILTPMQIVDKIIG